MEKSVEARGIFKTVYSTFIISHYCFVIKQDIQVNIKKNEQVINAQANIKNILFKPDDPNQIPEK